MDIRYLYAVVLVCMYCCCECVLLVGAGIAGAAVAFNAIAVGVYWGHCHFKECCTARWMKPSNNSKEIIHNIFKTRLFGQHLVMKVVPNTIYNHIHDNNPKKALVLSFHGWTGCGKSYVSSLIAEYIYREGMLSDFVHTKIASEHYPDDSKLETYKKELALFVREKTRTCGRGLFLFDEMDKMPLGLMDVLKPYVDYHHEVDGVDYRKNIFIFLNNVGGDQISQVTVQNFREGNLRESISSSIMERILSLTSLKKNGGFKDSDLILSGLVDFMIPFLPLERFHVRQCAESEIKRRVDSRDTRGDGDNGRLDRQAQKDVVDNVAGEMQYQWPEEVFSLSGCKQVAKKVDLYV